MSKHDNFIFTPITIEIQNAVAAMRIVDIGMEAFPLSEYVMHSLFLKMTGFQEQKMKCIAWEMATEDFDFRRELLSGRLGLGEYSTYEAKNKVYSSLLEIIRKHNSSEIPNKDDEKVKNGVTAYILENIKPDKKQIRKNTVDAIKGSFKNTNFAVWDQRKFLFFCQNGSDIIKETQYFNSDLNLLENQLQKYYEELYAQRNRLAHNVFSYQENLPSLIKLREENDYSRNFYIYFAILTLIDNIFMETYKVFKDTLENSNYY